MLLLFNLFKKTKTNSKIYNVLLSVMIFSFILTMFNNDEFRNAADNIDTDLYRQNPTMKNYFIRLFDRLYFVIVTTSTVGFGDTYPKTIITRLLTMIYIMYLLIYSYISI